MNYTIDDIITELEGFVYWLSHRKDKGTTILMDWEEISGELFLELVKGFDHYKEHDLPREEMIAVLKKMMDNRVAELVHKYYVTHRRLGNSYIRLGSLDELDDDVPIAVKSNVIIQAHVSVAGNPRLVTDSKLRIEELYALLDDNEDACDVLDAILEGNDLLQANLLLAGDRAAAVYKNGGCVRLRQWHVADALGMTPRQVKKAFRAIRRAYREVCDA